MPTLIHLTHLSKAYAAHPALADVSLSIPAHSFVALVGASGSGKTTLLKTINRLVTPDAGSVLLNGEDVAAIPADQLRRKIGYVFQGIGLFPHMSVAENIGIVQRLNGIPPRHAHAAEWRGASSPVVDGGERNASGLVRSRGAGADGSRHSPSSRSENWGCTNRRTPGSRST